MNSRLYFKNRLPFLLVNGLGLVLLSLFLLLIGNSVDSVLLIASVWLLLLAAGLFIPYRQRKKQLDKWLDLAEQLEERYLLAEVLPASDRADDQVFFQLLKLAERSMLEQVGISRRQRQAYQDDIEQWVHEVKTPLTAIGLLCENNRSPFTRDLLVETEKLNRLTEQVLYLARSEHPEKDYTVREISLSDVIHQAVADNKYLLRQNHVTVEVPEMSETIYSDDKWLRFILDQLIVNAVKYRSETPLLRFTARREAGMVLLYVEDNGLGIAESDLPRIFEKGFTGQNGRRTASATGMGLYLCRQLCAKLDIGLSARRLPEGTCFELAFRVNDLIREVQR